MAWYDLIAIFVGVIGILMMSFSSYENRGLMNWGLLFLVIGLIAEVCFWLVRII